MKKHRYSNEFKTTAVNLASHPKGLTNYIPDEGKEA